MSAEFPASTHGHTDSHAADDAHGEGHAHNPLVAHQFDDLAQQKEAGILGMWSFLATEIMFFGGALLAYAIYRGNYHYAFAAASNKEMIWVGFFNTLVLLASSFTVVLAVHHAQHGRNEKVVKWIMITIVLGLAFIGVKAFEYHHVYVENLIPGPNFDKQDLTDPHRHFNGHHFPEHLRRPAQIFFSFYFALTGIHALHMVVGVGIMLWVANLARKKEFSTDYYNPVEIAGLYWHFVDIVWIYLYPLLYLVDRTYDVVKASGH